MITKIRFVRDQFGQPILQTEVRLEPGAPLIETSSTLLSEEAYAEWVPETNVPIFKGENVKDGIVYDVPLKANLKG